MEVGSGSTELQVKVLYSDENEENSNSTPGWPGSPGGMQLYRGGSDMTLDVSSLAILLVQCLAQHLAAVILRRSPELSRRDFPS